MQLRQSQRQKAKIKMALQGPSGSGKTYSALLLAYGITNDWGKIAIIDTENGSADLYAHLGAYQVLSIVPPFSPETYIRAISHCESSGIEVVIIDSISHCWEFLLDYHSSLQGNSFTNWAKVTPRQKAFLDKILQSPCHIISTIRVKQDYVINQRGDGKMVPEKVGLKSVMKDGVEYEFTIVFDVDMKHNAGVSKDRTGLFISKDEFRITQETGKAIIDWCISGVGLEDIRRLIATAQSNESLTAVYNQYLPWSKGIEAEFAFRQRQLKSLNQSLLSSTSNHNQNGTPSTNRFPPN